MQPTNDVNRNERMDIVERYDKGVSTENTSQTTTTSASLASIEADRVDRYGFLIGSNDVANNQCYLDASQTSDEDAVKDKARRRENKWSLMLNNWHNVVFTEKVHSNTGVPDSLRSKVWRKLLRIDDVKDKYNRIQGGNFYNALREKARNESSDIRQIDLDVNRTFRENVYFRDRYNYRQQMLFHVLTSYSLFNQQVGYCQGMNNIAALLVMYFEAEEDAFWGLTQLMSDSRYMMEGFFLRNFPKFAQFELLFNSIISRLLPKVKKRLDTLSVSSTMYLFKWLINCYIDVLPFSLTLRVWDVFLAEGDQVLLAMAYNIMRIHERSIREMKTIDRFLEFVGTKLSISFGGIKEDVAVHKLNRALHKLRRLYPSDKFKHPSSAISSLALATFNLGSISSADVGILDSRVDDSEQQSLLDDADNDAFASNNSSRPGKTNRGVLEEKHKDRLDATASTRHHHPSTRMIKSSSPIVTSIVSTSFSNYPEIFCREQQQQQQQQRSPISESLSRSSSVYDNISWQEDTAAHPQYYEKNRPVVNNFSHLIERIPLKHRSSDVLEISIANSIAAPQKKNSAICGDQKKKKMLQEHKTILSKNGFKHDQIHYLHQF